MLMNINIKENTTAAISGSVRRRNPGSPLSS
jgi:hypothetical protein